MDNIKVYPGQDTVYKLTASSHDGNVEHDIWAKTLPAPVIESLLVPVPDLKNRINLDPIYISAPEIDVTIHIPEFTISPPVINLNIPDIKFDLPPLIEPDIDINDLKPKYKSAKSTFNFSKIYEYIRRKSRG